jgi:hypothetical protein
MRAPSVRPSAAKPSQRSTRRALLLAAAPLVSLALRPLDAVAYGGQKQLASMDANSGSAPGVGPRLPTTRAGALGEVVGWACVAA